MRTKIQESSPRARLATIAQLRATLLAHHLDPVPCARTLQAWFDQHQIPRFKANPCARRGGGPCYYSVAAVEKLLRSFLLPGRLAAPLGEETATPRADVGNQNETSLSA